MDYDATWYGGRLWPTQLCVRWRSSYPQKKGCTHSRPIFGPCLSWPNGWMKTPLGKEVYLSPCHIVLDGVPAPVKGAQQPSVFSAHVYCGQTAGCIRIPLGTEVVLSPGDIVLDGDPAPPRLKGHSSPIFGPFPVWPNSWMQ